MSFSNYSNVSYSNSFLTLIFFFFFLFYNSSGQNHENSGMGMVELGTIFLLLIFKEMLLMFHPYAIRLGFEWITLIIIRAFPYISWIYQEFLFFFNCEYVWNFIKCTLCPYWSVKWRFSVLMWWTMFRVLLLFFKNGNHSCTCWITPTWSERSIYFSYYWT